MSDFAIGALAVIVVINTLFIAGLTIGVWMVHGRLSEAVRKADPVLHKATETLAQVEETTAQLQQRIDHVLERTTELVDRVADRVDTTTAIAEEVVTQPLIGAASLAAGINRGLRTYSDRTAQNDGVKGEETDG